MQRARRPLLVRVVWPTSIILVRLLHVHLVTLENIMPVEQDLHALQIAQLHVPVVYLIPFVQAVSRTTTFQLSILHARLVLPEHIQQVEQYTNVQVFIPKKSYFINDIL